MTSSGQGAIFLLSLGESDPQAVLKAYGPQEVQARWAAPLAGLPHRHREQVQHPWVILLTLLGDQTGWVWAQTAIFARSTQARAED